MTLIFKSSKQCHKLLYLTLSDVLSWILDQFISLNPKQALGHLQKNFDIYCFRFKILFKKAKAKAN